jgi:OOP family OmpA-OmpF porin
MLGSTLGIATAQAQAQTKDIVLKNDIQGYAVDQRNVVVRSGTSLCWRSGSWTPAMAIAECDPDLVKKPAPPPAPVAAPVAPPAPKPAPPPPAPAAAKPCDFTVALASDQTFAFGKSVLSGPAKARLDSDVVAKLGSCAKVRLIVVTGHTDRLGSSESNQKLSEKRAQAVTEYLFAKGVSASLFDTMGAGKTQAAQGVPKCDDKLPRAKLIACLAPHRRVVVEVKGTAK